MREILFRGKTKKGEWCEGLPTRKSPLDKEVNRIQLIDDYLETDFTELFLVKDVLPETVGQYTGLTDKNGKKIFEGDIIKQIFRLKLTNGSLEREIISVVEYGISYAYSNVCGVCERFSDGSGIAMLSVMDTRGIVDCEVIGNIHDNPELMKGKEILGGSEQ